MLTALIYSCPPIVNLISSKKISFPNIPETKNRHIYITEPSETPIKAFANRPPI